MRPAAMTDRVLRDALERLERNQSKRSWAGRLTELRDEAIQRGLAPWAGPTMPSFVIPADGRSITCQRCGRTSYNAGDVENRYCGFCHVFHEG